MPKFGVWASDWIFWCKDVFQSYTLVQWHADSFFQFLVKELVKRSCGNAVGLVAAFVAVA